MSDKPLAGAVRAADYFDRYPTGSATVEDMAFLIQRDSGLLELVERAEKAAQVLRRFEADDNHLMVAVSFHHEMVTLEAAIENVRKP